jgi:N-acyl-D-aspartate/D-glutamate deacylase
MVAQMASVDPETRARDGYRATICNGRVILENGEHTGTRSGEVLRN